MPWTPYPCAPDAWPRLLAAFLRRFGEAPGTVVLESQHPRGEIARWSLLAAHPEAICGAEAGVAGLTKVDGGARDERPLTRENLASMLGLEAPLRPRAPERPDGEPAVPARPWLGYIGYEAGCWLAEMPEPLAAGADDLPDLWFARHRALLLWDHHEGRAWIDGETAGEVWGEDAAAEEPSRDDVGHETPAEHSTLSTEVVPDEFRCGVEAVCEYILAGDIFQANYTRRFTRASSARPVDLFRALRARNPASHAALLVIDAERAIVSASPELFLRTRPADGALETRPIKGTISVRRDDGATRDSETASAAHEAAAILRASAKDCAEHVMIVDVKRNDLGRLARPVVAPLTTAPASRNAAEFPAPAQRWGQSPARAETPPAPPGALVPPVERVSVPTASPRLRTGRHNTTHGSDRPAVIPDASSAVRPAVRVEELLAPLALPGLVHLESTVAADPRPDVRPLDAVAALFPGGSISGAPKIRACQIIRELEPTRRNVYTGAIGWLASDGINLSVAIRTLYRPRPGVWISHAGGGIVADSSPEAEWAECLAKEAALRRALAAASPEANTKSPFVPALPLTESQSQSYS